MALEDVIALAEVRAGKSISRSIAFRWMGSKDEPLRECIVETIVDAVFVHPDAIYPCVDIGITDLLADGTPLVEARIADFAPGPFQKNWTGRDGPYVRIVGGAFIAKTAGNSPEGMKANTFSIPDMHELK